jgi:GT2 family glycosyltransferase
MATPSPLYVLLATHERPVLLRRTLESLAECEQPESYRATIVVENGSKAGTERIVRACKDELNAKYIYTPRGNKSHALNVALQEVEDGLVFFTDDDVRVHPKTLCAYVQAANRTEKKAFFGGPVAPDYEKPPPDWIRPHLPDSASGWSLEEYPDRWYQFLGFNWAAYSEDIRTIGGFDERFGPGSGLDATGQETQMQLQLQKRGFKRMYVSDAHVRHYVPRERCSLVWLVRREFRNGISDGLRQALSSNAPSLARHLYESAFSISYDLLRLVKYSILMHRETSVQMLLDMIHESGNLYGFVASCTTSSEETESELFKD